MAKLTSTMKHLALFLPIILIIVIKESHASSNLNEANLQITTLDEAEGEEVDVTTYVPAKEASDLTVSVTVSGYTAIGPESHKILPTLAPDKEHSEDSLRTESSSTQKVAGETLSTRSTSMDNLAIPETVEPVHTGTDFQSTGVTSNALSNNSLLETTHPKAAVKKNSITDKMVSERLGKQETLSSQHLSKRILDTESGSGLTKEARFAEESGHTTNINSWRPLFPYKDLDSLSLKPTLRFPSVTINQPTLYSSLQVQPETSSVPKVPVTAYYFDLSSVSPTKQIGPLHDPSNVWAVHNSPLPTFSNRNPNFNNPDETSILETYSRSKEASPVLIEPTPSLTVASTVEGLTSDRQLIKPTSVLMKTPLDEVKTVPISPFPNRTPPSVPKSPDYTLASSTDFHFTHKESNSEKTLTVSDLGLQPSSLSSDHLLDIPTSTGDLSNKESLSLPTALLLSIPIGPSDIPTPLHKTSIVNTPNDVQIYPSSRIPLWKRLSKTSVSPLPTSFISLKETLVSKSVTPISFTHTSFENDIPIGIFAPDIPQPHNKNQSIRTTHFSNALDESVTTTPFIISTFRNNVNVNDNVSLAPPIASHSMPVNKVTLSVDTSTSTKSLGFTPLVNNISTPKLTTSISDEVHNTSLTPDTTPDVHFIDPLLSFGSKITPKNTSKTLLSNFTPLTTTTRIITQTSAQTPSANVNIFDMLSTQSSLTFTTTVNQFTPITTISPLTPTTTESLLTPTPTVSLLTPTPTVTTLTPTMLNPFPSTTLSSIPATQNDPANQTSHNSSVQSHVTIPVDKFHISPGTNAINNLSTSKAEDTDDKFGKGNLDKNVHLDVNSTLPSNFADSTVEHTEVDPLPTPLAGKEEPNVSVHLVTSHEKGTILVKNVNESKGVTESIESVQTQPDVAKDIIHKEGSLTDEENDTFTNSTTPNIAPPPPKTSVTTSRPHAITTQSNTPVEKITEEPRTTTKISTPEGAQFTLLTTTTTAKPIDSNRKTILPSYDNVTIVIEDSLPTSGDGLSGKDLYDNEVVVVVTNRPGSEPNVTLVRTHYNGTNTTRNGPFIKARLSYDVVEFCRHRHNIQALLAEWINKHLNDTKNKMYDVEIFHQPDCETLYIHDDSDQDSSNETDLYFYVKHNGSFSHDSTLKFPKNPTSIQISKELEYLREKILHLEFMNAAENKSLEQTAVGTSIVVIVVVSIVFVLLLAAAVFVFVLLKRRRSTEAVHGRRCTPAANDAYSLDSVSVFYHSLRRKSKKRASNKSLKSYMNKGFEDPNMPSRPLNFAKLTHFISDNEAIYEEFTNIPSINPKYDEMPRGVEDKNRYANVIPVPETRVLLGGSKITPSAEYINANSIHGPRGELRYYIATQAPLDNTVADFWQMIWEQESKVIVMLTDFVEKGIDKCADYLPPSETLDCHRVYGQFQITLKSRDMREEYIVSLLQIKNLENNLVREIAHMWFTGWPQSGVPIEEKLFISFIFDIRTTRKQLRAKGPIVVHCSPGTGRTGTFIACDLCIRQFDEQKVVDMPKTVYRIRRERAGAVQTREQYSFIYRVVNLYAAKLTTGNLDSF